MKLSFYITSDSFGLPDCSLKRLEVIVDNLSELSKEIRCDTNKDSLSITNEAYNIVWKGHSLGEVWTDTCQMDKDLKILIQKILQEYSKPVDFDKAKIDELILSNNEQERTVIIKATDNKGSINEDILDVENKNWFDIHRNFLGKYPVDCNYFVEECRIYFPYIYFHDRTKGSVRQILTEFSERIVHHLSGLNDKLRVLQNTFGEMNREEILEILSKKEYGNFDEVATLEGKSSRKEDFTFDFPLNSKENSFEKVCCEPHIKLCKSNLGSGDNSYHTDKRIYFHEGKSHIQDGKILVGHIGKHL